MLRAANVPLRTYSAEPTLMDAARAPYRLGWAFLLSWVFCVFYLQTIGPTSGDVLAQAHTLPAALSLYFETFPVFTSIAIIGVAVVLERRFGPPSKHPRLETAAVVLTAVGTPLLQVGNESVAATTLMFGVAAAITGIGSGIMWLMWGEYYARIAQEETELFGPVSAVVGAVITLGVTAMNGWVSVLVVASFPLLSGLCLVVSRRELGERAGLQANSMHMDGVSHGHGATAQGCASTQESACASEGTPSGKRARSRRDNTLEKIALPASMGRTLMGILVACLFVCVAGALVNGRGYGAGSIEIALVACIVFTLVIAMVSVVGPRRISISFFYRWMCPALVFGFASIVLFGDGLGSYLAFVTSVAARFAFCLITQMYFARIAAEGSATATQAYGWGWISVHFGDFLGVLATVAFTNVVATGSVTLNQIAVGCMVALVVVTMFVIDDKRSFTTPAEGFAEAPVGAQSIASAQGECASSGKPAPNVSQDSQAASSRTYVPASPAEAAQGSAETPHPKEAARLVGEASPVSTPPTASANATTVHSGVTSGSNAPHEVMTPGTSAPSGPETPTGAPSLDERIAAIARAKGLTPRESEVFALLARGRSIPYVRDALIISRETAATHAKHIYAKLDVHSRQELIDLVMGGKE